MTRNLDKATIVLTDFDGTLTTKDSLPEFIRFVFGDTAYRRGLISCLPWLVAYKLGLYPPGRAKEKLLGHFFRGIPMKQFEEWGELFADRIDQLVNKGVLAKIQSLLMAKVRVYVVTASVEQWVRPWCCSHLGVDGVIATQMETDARGMLTGRFLTPNCNGSEKLRRIKSEVPDFFAAKCIGFGDSRGDEAMLAVAHEAYRVVKGKLRRIPASPNKCVV